MKNNKQLDPEYRDDHYAARLLRLQPRYENDAVLWNSFRNGDNEALALIVDRYSDVLFKYGCKVLRDSETVKDNIQDLFIQLYKNRSSLGETCAIKLYLFKALRRRLFRARSREISLKTLITSYQSDRGVLSESPDHELILQESSDEQKRVATFLMSKLSLRQREAVFLRYYEGLDYGTVAEIMEVRKQAVYNLVHEAIELLRKFIKAESVNEFSKESVEGHRPALPNRSVFEFW